MDIQTSGIAGAMRARQNTFDPALENQYYAGTAQQQFNAAKLRWVLALPARFRAGILRQAAMLRTMTRIENRPSG